MRAEGDCTIKLIRATGRKLGIFIYFATLLHIIIVHCGGNLPILLHQLNRYISSAVDVGNRSGAQGLKLISLYSNSSLSLFVIGIFYVLEILRNGIGFFPYEFTVLNIILFYFNFFFLRMWIILETATSSSISIPTCQYSLLFYSIILALSIILGLKWTKKFDFQLKNIFTTSY